MEKELITISEYCTHYAVDSSFVNALEESGLIVFTIIDENKFIHYEQLIEMDRYVHFYYDMDINVEGIDAIMNLLQKVKQMQYEIKLLKSHIHLHQPNAS